MKISTTPLRVKANKLFRFNNPNNSKGPDTTTIDPTTTTMTKTSSACTTTGIF